MMIEAAKVIVPIGEGKEIEARATATGLRATTEPYPEYNEEEVLIWTEDENLFEESLLAQAVGEQHYLEVQVFVPDSLLTSAKAKMQDLGIPEARQVSEREWKPGAIYETRY
jgi:hypothetical protein